MKLPALLLIASAVSLRIASAQVALPPPRLEPRTSAATATVAPAAGSWLRVQVHVSASRVPQRRLTSEDFRVTLNGRPHAAVAVNPEEQTTSEQAEMVPVNFLIVIPPNQAVVQASAVQNLIKVWSERAPDAAWRVGVLDADGTEYPATKDPGQLLKTLEAIRERRVALSHSAGTWFVAANLAVRGMARLQGRRMVLFINSPADQELDTAGQYGLVRAGPGSLLSAARGAQAQLFIENEWGPGVAVPFGAASSQVPLGQSVDASPEGFRAAEERQTQRLAAYQSTALAAAEETGGEVARSVQDALRRMEQDLANDYQLLILLTPAEAERARVTVSVAVTDGRQAQLFGVAAARDRLAQDAKDR